MYSGSYGVIPDMPEWRYELLKKMGIEFSLDYKDKIFTEFTAYKNEYPKLYKGILCANQQNKGTLLKDFLHDFKLMPKKIIYFDDKLQPLESVGKICRDYSIPVILFNYRFHRLPDTWSYHKSLKEIGSLIKKYPTL